MKNKKSLILLVVGIVLILLSVGLLFYKFYLSKQEVETPPQVVTISDKLQNEFIDIINKYNISYLEKYQGNINNFNTILNNEKLEMSLPILESLLTTSPVLIQTLQEEYFQKVFAKETIVEGESTKCQAASTDEKKCQIIYDNESKTFTRSSDYQDTLLTEVYTYYSKVIDTKIENNSYSLTFVKIYYTLSDLNENPTKFYSNYNDALLQSNAIIELTDEEIAQTKNANATIDYKTLVNDKIATKDLTTLPKYTYRFIIQNNEKLLTEYNYSAK